jgi:predicted nucleic acid-binding protein
LTEQAGKIEEIVRADETDLHIPSLCDVEVTAGLRRALLRRILSERRAALAVEDYLDLPLTRHGHQSLLRRILDLGMNLSVYDATYVALAEQLGAALLTADQGLTRAVRSHTRVATLP